MNIDNKIKETKIFLENEVIPFVRNWELKNRGIPKKIVKKLGSNGFLTLLVDRKYGGQNLNLLDYCRLTELLAEADCGLANLINVNNSPVSLAIQNHGKPEQISDFLIPMTKGNKKGCFMLSEPQAGSDARNLKTTAKQNKEGFIVNGRKKFITGGSSADFGLLAAQALSQNGSKLGISLFLVDRKDYEVVKIADKLGHRNVDTAEIRFKNTKISNKNLLGPIGGGYKISLKYLNTGRIAVAAQAVGVALAAFKLSSEFAKKRVTFSKPIIEHQAIGHKLSEMAVKITAARELTKNAASLHHQGKGEVEASIAKLYSSKIAEEVTSEALHIAGGHGYMEDNLFAKLYRDAKVLSIYEGTSDIQNLIIARRIAKGWTPST